MGNKVRYRIYEVIEYLVDVDPEKVDFNPSGKKCYVPTVYRIRNGVQCSSIYWARGPFA